MPGSGVVWEKGQSDFSCIETPTLTDIPERQVRLPNLLYELPVDLGCGHQSQLFKSLTDESAKEPCYYACCPFLSSSCLYLPYFSPVLPWFPLGPFSNWFLFHPPCSPPSALISCLLRSPLTPQLWP